MEALSFLKFWRPSTFTTVGTTPPPYLDTDSDDDDSFFELELSLPDLDAPPNPIPKNNERIKQSVLSPSLSLSPSSLFSRRKIMPIEAQPSPRPQSPISIFKSSPKFRVSMFRKSKSMPNPKEEETEETLHLSRAKSSLSANMIKFNSVGDIDASLFDGSVSKRFSKDGVQKYLKLVKPFSGKDQPEEVKPSSRNMLRASPLSSSAATAKKLSGKSKLAAVNVGVVSPARNDGSWAQYNDGIQGAILHCKKSLHSTPRDCSMLSSRSPMHPLQREYSVPVTA